MLNLIERKAMTRNEIIENAAKAVWQSCGELTIWGDRFYSVNYHSAQALVKALLLPPDPPTARQAAKHVLQNLDICVKNGWTLPTHDCDQLSRELRTALDDEAKVELSDIRDATNPVVDPETVAKMVVPEKPMSDSERDKVIEAFDRSRGYTSVHSLLDDIKGDVLKILFRKGTTGASGSANSMAQSAAGPTKPDAPTIYAPASPEDHGCPALHPVSFSRCVLVKGHSGRHACRADDDFWYWTIPDQPEKRVEPSAPASPDPVDKGEQKVLDAHPNDPILTWTKPMTSAEAARYHLTSGFVAIELYRIAARDEAKAGGVT
jgi:hypothetical protein